MCPMYIKNAICWSSLYQLLIIINKHTFVLKNKMSWSFVFHKSSLNVLVLVLIISFQSIATSCVQSVCHIEYKFYIHLKDSILS